MLTRYEYLYTKNKAKKLSDKLFEFENGRMWDEKKKEFKDVDTYKKYLIYVNYSEKEKNELKDKWNAYYQECAKSPYGKIFWAMKPLYFLKDIPAIKELAKKAKELFGVAPIKKPSSVDPFELLMSIASYHTLRYELKVLNDIVDEYQPIYEKSDDKGGL